MLTTTNQSKQYIIIMAGGSGTRMNTVLPKQLLDIGNLPMLVHIFNHCSNLNKDIILILSNKNKDIILETLSNRGFIINIDNNTYSYQNIRINIIIQPFANGTGGAILATKNYFINNDPNDTCLILSADVPLITENTIKTLLTEISDNKINAIILAKDTKDNYGYGRIIMDNNTFVNIVEHRDCDDEQKKITLINTGIYAFKIGNLLESLKHIDNKNSQKEYYLTDCPKIINNHGMIKIIKTTNYIFDETYGANTYEQLETLRQEYLKKFSIENINNNEINLTDINLRNLIGVLEQLTEVGITDIKTLREHINNKNTNMHIYIVKYEDNIIGTGTILIEDKIIHNFGKVAHIEDVVIDNKYRGLGIAKKLIDTLIDVSKEYGCYKIILDSSDDVKPFYEKLGFQCKANCMRLDLIQ